MSTAAPRPSLPGQAEYEAHLRENWDRLAPYEQEVALAYLQAKEAGRLTLAPPLPAAARPHTRTPDYAGFWIRAVARVIDGIILVVVEAVLGQFIHDAAAASLVMGTIGGWLYYAGFAATTPGKMALGLAVTDLDGLPLSFWHATGRYFAEILSCLLLGIGYLMVAFTANKQGLHDKIADTVVVRAL